MYTLAKQLTTQNLTSNSLFWLSWNIATFVINTNLHQNDMKIDIFYRFSVCFGFSSFSQNAVFCIIIFCVFFNEKVIVLITVLMQNSLFLFIGYCENR